MPKPQTKPLIKEVPMVENLAAIRVQVLKKKFVEQMPRLTNQIPDKIEVLGVVTKGAMVICKDEKGHLVTIHRMDWMDHLMGDAHVEEFPRANKEATEKINSYPQLFED